MSLFTHNILFIILSILFLFLVFRITQMLINKFIGKEKRKKQIRKISFFIELMVWFILMYHIAEDFKLEKPILSLISAGLLILIVLWAFLYVLKDYFAGLYFKIFEDYQLNNRISFDNISGNISAFESRYLVLQTSEGSLKIPYSMLFGVQISRLPEKNQEELNIFLSAKATDINEDYIENLRNKILLMPWINLKYIPEITVLDKENENIRIKLVLLDTKFKKNVEEYLS